MSKRYYYTDPLAAAWMAKHFEMRFQGENGPLEINSDEGSTWFCEECDLGHKYMVPFYIHPASIAILEPQEYDIYINPRIVKKNALGVLPVASGSRQTHWKNCALSYGSLNVIQRNGKAFHWPEVEE